ncbi:LysR substrate-binding domain-containing protein, partial [Bacillus altitudinis]|uniref:LysR substrate-binding domain-containing protein n=1 Tax=Bacillus altitudinis TaxID=293387 RepID=UPI003B525D65
MPPFIPIPLSHPTPTLQFPPLIPEFNQTFPNLQFSLQVPHPNTFTSLLSHHHIHFPISPPPQPSIHNTYNPLFQHHILLLLPSSHQLPQRPLLHLTHLNHHTILFTPHNSPIR